MNAGDEVYFSIFEIRSLNISDNCHLLVTNQLSFPKFDGLLLFLHTYVIILFQAFVL